MTEFDKVAHLDRIQSKPKLDVSDVATLLSHGRVTFEEAKALLSEIEVEISPSLSWDEKMLGEDKTYLDNDPIHLAWLTLGANGISYDQVHELYMAMKRPRK
jgi:hypothetical protein